MADSEAGRLSRFPSLEAGVSCDVLYRGDAAYDDARRVWNARFDRRPDLIVRPTNTEEEVAAVNTARQAGLTLSAKGGGHSYAGVAGFTLGGGAGWLTRNFGMAVDNLVATEVVTATGEVVRASETEHPDLFWALRGGGGNFGVVTRFEYRLHPIPKTMLAGQVLDPVGRQPSLPTADLEAYRLHVQGRRGLEAWGRTRSVGR